MRFITLRSKRCVLSPDDTDAKSGRPVFGVLWEKHLALIVPNVEVLEYYVAVPEFVPLDVTEDTVETISGQLTGAAGTGGINTAGLHNGYGALALPASACVVRLRCSPAECRTTSCPGP